MRALPRDRAATALSAGRCQPTGHLPAASGKAPVQVSAAAKFQN